MVFYLWLILLFSAGVLARKSCPSGTYAHGNSDDQQCRICDSGSYCPGVYFAAPVPGTLTDVDIGNMYFDLADAEATCLSPPFPNQQPPCGGVVVSVQGNTLYRAKAGVLTASSDGETTYLKVDTGIASTC